MKGQQDNSTAFEHGPDGAGTRFGNVFSARRSGKPIADTHHLLVVEPALANKETLTRFPTIQQRFLYPDTAPHWVTGCEASPPGSSKLWLAWERQAHALYNVNNQVRQIAPGGPAKLQEALFPILAKVAQALDELIEKGLALQDITLSADFIWIDFEQELGTRRTLQHFRREDWGRCTPRFLPGNLDWAISTALTPDLDRRSSWQKMPLSTRFAGVIYGIFGGPSHVEGCPKNSPVDSAPMLGREANRHLLQLLNQAGHDKYFSSAQELVEVISRPEGKRVRRPEEPPLAPAVPNSIPEPQRRQISEQDLMAARRTRMIQTLGGAAAAMAIGAGLFFGLRRDPPPAPPVAAADATPLAQPTPVPGSVPSPAPPEPAPPPQPTAASTKTLAQQVSEQVSAGQPKEAETLLLTAAAAQPALRLALLRQAMTLNSVRAASLLSTDLKSASPKEAATLAWTGYQLQKSPTALPDAQAAADCLKLAASLSLADALLETGARQLQTGADANTAVDALIKAAQAYASGNAVTDPAPAKRAEVIRQLGQPSALPTISARATKAAADKAADAHDLAKLCYDAGGRDGPILLANESLAAVSVYTGVDLNPVVALLREGERRSSAAAMVKLAELFFERTANFAEKGDDRFNDQQRRALLQKASDMDHPTALFILGGIHMGDRNFDSALVCFRRAETLGVPNAARMIATVQRQIKASPVP